jgi:hypothetical protein
MDACQNATSDAETLSSEIDKLCGILMPFKDLPKIQDQQNVCRNLETKIYRLQPDLNNTKQQLDHFDSYKKRVLDDVKVYYSKYSLAPEEIIRQAYFFNENKNEIVSSIKIFSEEVSSGRLKITQELEIRITALQDWGLVHQTAKSAEAIWDWSCPYFTGHGSNLFWLRLYSLGDIMFSPLWG